jgi:hypothetical protein
MSSRTASSAFERRGRFEVYPENPLTHAEWLAFPKAPAGYVELARASGSVDARVRAKARAGEASQPSRYDVTLTPGLVSVVGRYSADSSGSGLVVAPGSLLAVSAGASSAEAQASALRQYTAALSALSSLRGSLLGMGKSLGISGDEGTLTLGRESVHEPGVLLNTGSGREEGHDGGPPLPAPFGSVSLQPPVMLARTFSGMSAITTNSASSALGEGVAEALRDADKVKGDSEALSQLKAAKTKLVQDNKALQAQLEQAKEQVVVLQQKLKRHGLQ